MLWMRTNTVNKTAKCKELARKLRGFIKSGDTMHPLWDVIFDLEAVAREEPDKRFLKNMSVDWLIEYAESVLEAYENKA